MSAITSKEMVVSRNKESLTLMNARRSLIYSSTSLPSDIITNTIIPYLTVLYQKNQEDQVKLLQSVDLTLSSTKIHNMIRCGIEIMPDEGSPFDHFYYFNKARVDTISCNIPDDLIDDSDFNEIISEFEDSSDLQKQNWLEAVDKQLNSKCCFTYTQIKNYTVVYKLFYGRKITFLELSRKVESSKLIFDLSNSAISDKGMMRIASAFAEKVHCLSAWDARMSTLEGFSFFRSLQHLSMNLVGPIKINSLPPSLVYLNLDDIVVESPEFLAHLKSLEWLNISCVRGGIKGFVFPTSLRHLECRDNNLIDINFIRPLKSLVFLDASNNPKLQDISAVAEFSLEYLKIDNCPASKDFHSIS